MSRLTIDDIAEDFIAELKRYVKVRGAAPHLAGHLELNIAFSELVKRIDYNQATKLRRRTKTKGV